MTNRKRIITIIFIYFLFEGFISLAQNDSLNDQNAKVFTAINFLNADSLNSIDNSLDNFQNYYYRNSLGGIGLPANNGIVFNGDQNLNFKYYKNNSAGFFYYPNTAVFYKTRTPFSDLFYVAGSKREQLFRGTFSYNPLDRLNITLKFSRLRSDGFFLRQNLIYNNLALSSNYLSKKSKYGFLVFAAYNDISSSENGGIKDDSNFINSSSAIDRALVDVNLSVATRKIKNKNFLFKQFFYLGKMEVSKDSSESKMKASSVIAFSAKFNDELIEYKDDNPVSQYYNSIFYDSIKTYDSSYFYTLAGDVEWKRMDNGNRRGIRDMFGLAVNYSYEINGVKQKQMDTLINNSMLGVRLFNLYSVRKIWYELNGAYGLSGFNEAGLVISGRIKKEIFRKGSYIEAEGGFSNTAPDFIYSKYYSNHFRWNNSFENQQVLNYSGRIYFSKFKTGLSFTHQNISNILYFANRAVARQYAGDISILKGDLTNHVSLLNWHLLSQITYQYVEDSTVVRLPSVVLNGSLYYENDVFKKAMLLQLGLSCLYNTSYFANRYSPITGQFYLQDERKYGNYPMVDIFINAKVKAVRVFIKIEHLNDGLMSQKYIPSPNYPMGGRAYKIGVSWRFFD